MKRSSDFRSHRSRQSRHRQNLDRRRVDRRRPALPSTAYRQRGVGESGQSEAFNAPEVWYETVGRDQIKYICQPAGTGYVHPVTIDDVADRMAALPDRLTRGIEVVQLSRMTRKRALFPCYGMQWGSSIYLYPIEESLVEIYVRPPSPQQLIEARMYGGLWSRHEKLWQLTWAEKTIRDFYLNNVLIHEIGHINDDRNANFDDRERYANWFAIEYGFRATRGRR